MACPLCGERCTCSFIEQPTAGGNQTASSQAALLVAADTLQDSEQQFLATLGELSQPPASNAAKQDSYRSDYMWRQEVASRVDAFRARRGRPRRDRSAMMRFDFERATASAVEPSHRPSPPTDAASDPAREPPLLPVPPPVPIEAKVIEFPRSVAMIAEELAEPVIETPRILEVPPEEIAPQSFGGVSLPTITLEQHRLAEQAPAQLRVAARGLRILGGLVDASIVLVAATLFVMIFMQIADTVPRTRMGLVLAVVIPVFFWAVYQYIFLVHANATPGMKIANLRLNTYDGKPATADLRRWRAIAMIVSCISVGLGFAWTWLDPDGLCWHDKITRTYLTQGDK